MIGNLAACVIRCDELPASLQAASDRILLTAVTIALQFAAHEPENAQPLTEILSCSPDGSIVKSVCAAYRALQLVAEELHNFHRLRSAQISSQQIGGLSVPRQKANIVKTVFPYRDAVLSLIQEGFQSTHPLEVQSAAVSCLEAWVACSATSSELPQHNTGFTLREVYNRYEVVLRIAPARPVAGWMCVRR